MSGQNDHLTMTIRRRKSLTAQIAEFSLVPVASGRLPSYEAGAHITVRTPCGAMRRYSLVDIPGEQDQYVIAVKNEPDSRGGSRSMHEEAREGTQLVIEPPQNDFPLNEAQRYLLIAGGIGVTPIFSMGLQLARENRDFRIIYCSRSAQEAAYLEPMGTAFEDRLIVHHDHGDPELAYDFWEHFAEVQNMHVYCCGPKNLMEEVKAMTGHWPEGRVNFEDFKPVEVVRPEDVEFEVELARSGDTVTVPADRTILETLRESGYSTVSSCESGTCGTCKTGLIAGEADHRDMVLLDEERSDNIMICVSRSKGGRLVIDR